MCCWWTAACSCATGEGRGRCCELAVLASHCGSRTCRLARMPEHARWCCAGGAAGGLPHAVVRQHRGGRRRLPAGRAVPARAFARRAARGRRRAPQRAARHLQDVALHNVSGRWCTAVQGGCVVHGLWCLHADLQAQGVMSQFIKEFRKRFTSSSHVRFCCQPRAPRAPPQYTRRAVAREGAAGRTAAAAGSAAALVGVVHCKVLLALDGWTGVLSLAKVLRAAPPLLRASLTRPRQRQRTWSNHPAPAVPCSGRRPRGQQHLLACAVLAWHSRCTGRHDAAIWETGIILDGQATACAPAGIVEN